VSDLTPEVLDEAEKQWRQLVADRLRRELDAKIAECTQIVDEYWKKRLAEDQARLTDLEAQSGCMDPDCDDGGSDA